LLYSQELWSYGMGLLYEDDSQKYTHRAKEFAIYNAGNVAVHPFEQYLRIAIENAVEGYRLRNTTTGDEFKYTGNNKGKLVINVDIITIKVLEAFSYTNRENISLAPGWNYLNKAEQKKLVSILNITINKGGL